jgi:endoglycosylceramidase
VHFVIILTMFIQQLAALFAVCAVAVADSLPNVKINPATHGFVDELGRTRIFHGMNAVYKAAPWHPDVEGFDPLNSLSDIDAKNMQGWGFNIVRLGVMWPGVEPSKGQYNATYLDQLEIIVKNLADSGVYVILDFHQDLWHRQFCGEGVPDYVYEACVAEEPDYKLIKSDFPHPAVNATYPNDVDGNPSLDSCLSVGFATYYLSAEVGAGFQCLYDNKQGLWDNFGAYWQQVAARFSGHSSVLGYELINEPWVGDVYEDPLRFLPGRTEKDFLQPMYQHVAKMIREVDDEKIIFYEGLTIDYWPIGFQETPGGSEYDDRQALSYHIYCPLSDPSVKAEAACDVINSELFNNRQRDVERLGGGWLMTEFGASRDIKGDMYALNFLCEKMDKHQQSWMYWQYKYYNDITTCTPEGEALYLNNGTVAQDKLRVLSRSYPEVVAGTLLDYSFHVELSGLFTMNYQPWTASASTNPLARISSVYYNEELYYPKGVHVKLSYSDANGDAIDEEALPDGTSVEVQCHNHRNVNLIHSASTAETAKDISVKVLLSPCVSSNRLTCTCIA